MAIIQFSAKVTSLQRIPELKLTNQQTKQIGKYAIDSLVSRVQNKHTDIYDSPMPPYTNRPVYVKLGKSRGKIVLKSGRVPIASVDSLRQAGAKIIRVKSGTAANIRNAVINTGKSLKFPNRAAYKRFLGKSGLRDLTETGAMLGALMITSTSGIYAKVITISFTDPVQERKAAGNMRWADWFGLSPSDERKIVDVVENIFAQNLGIPVGAKSLSNIGIY